jgi:hypothetical protein
MQRVKKYIWQLIKEVNKLIHGMTEVTSMNRRRCVTFGTCGLNSTALCIASTAVTSAVVSPLLLAISGENLSRIRTTSHHNSFKFLQHQRRAAM